MIGKTTKMSPCHYYVLGTITSMWGIRLLNANEKYFRDEVFAFQNFRNQYIYIYID